MNNELNMRFIITELMGFFKDKDNSLIITVVAVNKTQESINYHSSQYENLEDEDIFWTEKTITHLPMTYQFNYILDEEGEWMFLGINHKDTLSNSDALSVANHLLELPDIRLPLLFAASESGFYSYSCSN